MKLKAYSIRDTKGEIFHAPFYQPTYGLAERHFESAVNDPRSTINQFPEDFDLYYVGEYDDQTGKFETPPTPEHQIKAVQLKKAAEPAAQTNV